MVEPIKKTVLMVSASLPEDGYSESESSLDKELNADQPRLRRAQILTELFLAEERIQFLKPPNNHIDLLEAYRDVHIPGLLQFFRNAWAKWQEEEEEGPLFPSNLVRPRDPHAQRASNHNATGQMGYYCTDWDTPLYGELWEELKWDAAVVSRAVEEIRNNHKRVVYALPVHPGHHAARDSFGGSCYLNHAAWAVQLLSHKRKAAILDLAYHCGNGTASILFQDNPNVLVVSVHCHPDYDYPYHCGFQEDSHSSTVHYPLVPNDATWQDQHRLAVPQALEQISIFGAEALVISFDGNRRGVLDYHEMGQRIGSACSKVPSLLLQEGGDAGYSGISKRARRGNPWRG